MSLTLLVDKGQKKLYREDFECPFGSGHRVNFYIGSSKSDCKWFPMCNEKQAIEEFNKLHQNA